jgi:hypothetical protein
MSALRIAWVNHVGVRVKTFFLVHMPESPIIEAGAEKV